MRFYRIKKTKYGYLPQTTTLLQWLWYGEWHTIGYNELFLKSETRNKNGTSVFMSHASSHDEALKTINHYKKIAHGS